MSERILDQLRDAKVSKASWYEIGRLLRDGQAAAKDGAVRFRSAAAEATGYSDNVLRRFTARASYVDRLLEAGVQIPATRLAKAFTAIELVERIAALDDEEGSRRLQDWLAGRTTVAELRKGLRRLTAPVSSMRSPTAASMERRWAAMERTARRRHARERIGRSLATLSGRGYRLMTIKNAAGPVRCEMVALNPEATDDADGFDVAYLPGRVAKAELQDLVARSMLTSTLFRQFYIVLLNDTDPRNAARVLGLLDFFGAASVGVVGLWEAAGEKIGTRSAPATLLRRPTGPPSPDRRTRLKDVLVGNVWKAFPPRTGGEDLDEGAG